MQKNLALLTATAFLFSCASPAKYPESQIPEKFRSEILDKSEWWKGLSDQERKSMLSHPNFTLESLERRVKHEAMTPEEREVSWLSNGAINLTPFLLQGTLVPKDQKLYLHNGKFQSKRPRRAPFCQLDVDAKAGSVSWTFSSASQVGSVFSYFTGENSGQPATLTCTFEKDQRVTGAALKKVIDPSLKISEIID